MPELTGRVVDQAHLLSPLTEQRLTQQLRQHADSTSNQVAVLTIESLQGEVLEQYSLRVARTWGLGQEEFDNGVLVLIAEEEQRIRIEVGYGLEGALPDAVANRIIETEMVPRFRQGHFDAGTRAGTLAILDAIDGAYPPPTTDGSEGEILNELRSRLLAGLFGAFLFFFVYGTFFSMLRTAAKSGWKWWLFITLFRGPVLLLFGMTSSMGIGVALFGNLLSAVVAFVLAVSGLLLLLYFWLSVHLLRHPDLKAVRDSPTPLKDVEGPIDVGGFSVHPPRWAGDSGAVSLGGGFSGGGGGFGGGGASGGW